MIRKYKTTPGFIVEMYGAGGGGGGVLPVKLPELPDVFGAPPVASSFTTKVPEVPPPDPNDKRRVLHSHADYLAPVINNPAERIKDARKKLRGVKFDTFVGTGISGALIAPLLARAMKKHFAIVRKDKDGSHSCKSVEGNLGRAWVFVDDLICSGETRMRVREVMKHFCDRNAWAATYVGDYYYLNPRFERRIKENGNV